jgi:hypothetical protein
MKNIRILLALCLAFTALGQSSITVVTNVAGLLQLTPVPTRPVVRVLGEVTANDGLGRDMLWAPDSVLATNTWVFGGPVSTPMATGRWLNYTNSAGSGGTAIGAAGTTGTLSKFTSSTNLGNSTLTESGTNVTATGNFIVNNAFTLGASSDAILRRDAAGTISQRNAANAQESRVYGTYTDASNGRWLRLDTTTGGANVIAAEGNGTGVAANTLQLSVNTLAAADIAADGDITANYDLNAASGNVLTRIRTQAGTAPAIMLTPAATSRVDATLVRWAPGTGDFSIATRVEVPVASSASFQSLFGLYEDANNRMLLQLPGSDTLRFDAYEGGVAVTQNVIVGFSARYAGQVVDIVLTRVGTTITAFINGVQVMSGANASADFSYTAAAKFVSGNRETAASSPYLSRIYNTQLYTRALSAADCADLAQKGVNPADQWVDGSALYTQNTSAGVDGWSGTRSTVTGNVDGIGTPSTDNTLRITSDSTAASTHFATGGFGQTVGKRYRITASILNPTTNAIFGKVQLNFGGVIAGVLTGRSDTWQAVSYECVTISAASLSVYPRTDGDSATFDGNGTDVIYLKNVTVTPIGCALAWDFVGPGPTFADDSSNAYLGLGVGVSQTLPSSGGTYSYEARFLASAISASAGTTKLIDLPANAGVMNVEVLRNSAMDAAVTLDVGTSGTAAKYASAMAMDATGLLFADSLSKGSESATAITPLYIKKSGATTVGDITVRITIQARN